MSTAFPRARARLLSTAISLSIASAALSGHVAAQDAGAASNRALLDRIEALERRLGVGTADASPPADGDTPVTVADLDQRLRVLERKLELQAEDAAAKAAKDPVVALSTAKGLSIKSPDGIELKLRGLVQADGRFFAGDTRVPQNKTFLFRRVEPTLEGNWGPLLAFRIQAQFAGDSAALNDAYLDVKLDPRATVRIGKFKQPVGLEQLQSSGGLATVERGFPAELTPARDIGVQLQGEFRDGALSYAVGAFNGTPDGRDGATSNPDNELEYAARVFWEPFRSRANGLSGLGIGVGGSVGDAFGTGNAALPRYRTPGQAQFFAYGSNVAADGLRRRWAPQAYFYRGPFGAQAEYNTSEQEVRVVSGVGAGRRKHLKHEAYQLTASWVFTGEDAGYRGVARPNRPFAVGGEGWGAFELVGRYGELRLDGATFPLFANLNTSAREARSWTIGLNWYLTNYFKLVADYSRTRFDRGAAAGADRETENAFFTRAQFSF